MILQHQWGFCRGCIEVADLPIIDDQTLSTVVWGLGGEIHALFRDQPMDCLDAPKETLGSRWGSGGTPWDSTDGDVQGAAALRPPAHGSGHGGESITRRCARLPPPTPGW